MYWTPIFSSNPDSFSRETDRKEARYELATLLTRQRFKDAMHLADSYLSSNVIRPEDHAFVIEIACVADPLLQTRRG